MKNIILFALFHVMVIPCLYAQDATNQAQHKQAIEALIDQLVIPVQMVPGISVG